MEGLPRRILVAEDDPAIARLYLSLFADDQLVIVESVRQVMRALNDEPPEALILDYGLLFSNAEEVISHGIVLPPTVVVSGNPLAVDFAKRIGAPFIPKPFDIDYLESVIERLIGARNEEQPAHVE